MEHNCLVCIILPCIFLITIKFFFFFFFFSTRYKKLPPCPPSFPIIGNIHQVKQPIHNYFHDLSQKYGPVFTLKFGSQLVAVVSSASAAEECFTKNDIIFANRLTTTNTKYFGYNNTNMITSSYGDHWRNLHRISSLEILSTHRLDSFSIIRKDETMRLIQKLSENSHKDFTKFELRPLFSELTFNTIMRMVCGKCFYGDESHVAKKFRDVMNEIQEFGLGSNLGDFVPLIRWFDFSGSEKKIKMVGKKMDALFQGLVDDIRNNRKENKNTMIDHLLSLQESEPDYYTDQIIKGLMMSLMVNAWTIHRDPNLWADPMSFKPERFEDGRGADMHGFIPFGMGRRACPGSGLAQRTLAFTLGSLIQCFDWKRIGKEEVNMTE